VDRSAELGGRIVQKSSGSTFRHVHAGTDNYQPGFNRMESRPSAADSKIFHSQAVEPDQPVHQDRRVLPASGSDGDGAATQFAAYESRQVTYVPFTRQSGMADGPRQQFMSFQYGFWNWYYRRNGLPTRRDHDQLTGLITGITYRRDTTARGPKGIKGTLNCTKPGLLWATMTSRSVRQYPESACGSSTVDRGAAGNYISSSETACRSSSTPRATPESVESVNYFGVRADNWTIAGASR
jgi:hypothetical protein